MPKDPFTMGDFEVVAYHRPAAGGTRSGDRFLLETRESSGELSFLLADAVGHGARGAAFWQSCGEHVRRAWRKLVASEGSLDDLGGFATSVNDRLHGSNVGGGLPHVCVAVGALAPTGRLRFMVCGYGTHVLPIQRSGSCWAPAPQRFGLKLG